MQKLVTYSEEGHKLDDQGDVPVYIRDLMYEKAAKRGCNKQEAEASFGGLSDPDY